MTKAKYVDGFVLAIPKKHVVAYKKLAKEAATTWMKFGALNYKECMADNVRVGEGMLTLTFSKLLKQKKGETIWFSYVEYKSRKHRDMVNKKVMAHFNTKYKGKEMPAFFKSLRMAAAGFSVEVSS